MYFKLVKRISLVLQYFYTMGLINFVFHYVRYKVRTKVSEFITLGTETVIVETVQGSLRGRKCKSALDKTLYKFQGVPYAKPPVGPLRFKDPESPEPWEGVRNAMKEGNICAQYDIITGTTRGSENCLYLNVFTPQLQADEQPPCAVLVWVHGGAFQIGSGNAEVYGPDFFLEENVILITLNYRLGALGFLSTGTEDAPGNAGLKDIVMALKWVQQNIAKFGGDPNNVTVFGESAGGAAVHYLLLSPLTKGLFQKAISQSGSALCHWAYAKDPLDNTHRLGKTFGCESKDPKALVECLRKVSAQTLARRQNTALSDIQKRELTAFAFVPCAEPAGYDQAFIKDDPLSIVSRGEFHDLPYMTGVNEREGLIILKQIADKKPSPDVLDKDFERVIPWTLGLEYGSDESKMAAKKLKEFYFQNKPLSKKTFINYVDLTSDSNFIEPTHRTTLLHSTLGQSPVYNYLFTYDGHFGFFKRVLGFINIPGPSHADELGYMFHVPIIGPNTDPKTEDMKVVKKLVKLWTNFAKYSDPTPDVDDDLNVKWEPARPDEMNYLEINSQLKEYKDLYKERMELWAELAKLKTTNQSSL